MGSQLHLENIVYKFTDKKINGFSHKTLWGLHDLWSRFRDTWSMPVVQVFMNLIYSLYANLSVINVTIYSVKYVPMVFYMYQFIKKTYKASRERIEKTWSEIEDLKCQVEVIDTKLQVCQFTTLKKQLCHAQDRLNRIRARVRDVITRHDTMRQVVHAVPEEDSLFFSELMKEFKFDASSLLDMQLENMDCGEGDTMSERIQMERAQTEPSTPEHSVYSSLSDLDIKQDYRVKIVKVTNVYKVAYLKHFIKHKRLRRATKQALLRKKAENIKKLLNDWQRTLDMVINSKVTLMNMEPRKSDANLQTNCAKHNLLNEIDVEPNNKYVECWDDCSLGSSTEFYKNHRYSEDCCDSDHNLDDEPDVFKYNRNPEWHKLYVVPEETNSQVRIAANNAEDSEENLIML